MTCRPHNRHFAEEAFGKDFVAEKIDDRQRRSQAARSPSERVEGVERVARGEADASCAAEVTSPSSLSPATVEDLERATRGLLNMGFAKPEVKRALDIVCARRAGQRAPVETLLREAIQTLT
ncbi:MAG: hypothetical protein JST00_42535 [Deltaproteobacteria bacterium]|nr:hypothetical protein [Deltaproteobacteria bacterium]